MTRPEKKEVLISLLLVVAQVAVFAVLVYTFSPDVKSDDEIWCEENNGRWMQVYRGHTCVFPPVKE